MCHQECGTTTTLAGVKLEPLRPVGSQLAFIVAIRSRTVCELFNGHGWNVGQVPIDNNWVENRIRPIALGRSNWLFAGSLRAGQWAAAVMSLIQSAKLNGHDPYAYLKDVLERLPTQPASRIAKLLPHRWQAIARP